ncbi:Hypothetical_protein [Hexamita inflata]|uniref:Hypothetical_protein n=1 Tax=Hexamita inflata TaxID=28002 RepID=A0AA86P5K9_9EUKA|nr:Hypothetical protein HINF_LOCUS19836 [Hexamita inflata]
MSALILAAIIIIQELYEWHSQTPIRKVVCTLSGMETLGVAYWNGVRINNSKDDNPLHIQYLRLLFVLVQINRITLLLRQNINFVHYKSHQILIFIAQGAISNHKILQNSLVCLTALFILVTMRAIIVASCFQLT